MGRHAWLCDRPPASSRTQTSPIIWLGASCSSLAVHVGLSAPPPADMATPLCLQEEVPFAHPLSVYPVFKAPRKVPTFRERKEVSSRACRPARPAWVCMNATGALLVASAVLATHGHEGWQKSWPAQQLRAGPTSPRLHIGFGHCLGCQLLLGARQVLWRQPMNLTTTCGLVPGVRQAAALVSKQFSSSRQTLSNSRSPSHLSCLGIVACLVAG